MTYHFNPNQLKTNIMKKVLLVLIAVLSFTACSNDNDDNNLSEIESQLLGKWFFENPNNNPTVNNSFTFTSDGKVTYSNWDGGSGNNYDSETGTFSFNGDVMTMTFPEDVSLTFVQKVVFINDNVVEFEETGVSNENAYDGVYYRDGALSYEGVVEQLSASTQLHKVEFKTGTLDTWVSVSLSTKLTSSDGTESTRNSEFDRTQNIVSVEIPIGTAKFEIDFYIEDSSQAEMRFYNSVDNVDVHKETVNQQSFKYQYSF